MNVEAQYDPLLGLGLRLTQSGDSLIITGLVKTKMKENANVLHHIDKSGIRTHALSDYETG